MFLRRGQRLPPYVEIALVAFAMGLVACLALIAAGLHLLANWGLPWLVVGVYVLLTVPLFHMSEFLVACLYRPHDASPNAFVLYHSHAYVASMTVAWIELTLHWFVGGSGLGNVITALFPSNTSSCIWIVVTAMVAAGFYGLRLAAMVQCAEHFSHQVEYRRRPEHQLVKTGLYRTMRHPAYAGWLGYAVVTQLVVGNWFCALLFAVVTWKFFNGRIADEEGALLREEFFGSEYRAYRSATWSGLPFIV